MATGYALLTGRVQVVLLHAAAGLLQGANAIHGALLTGVPDARVLRGVDRYGDGAGPDPGSQWYRNLSVVGGPQAIAAPLHQVVEHSGRRRRRARRWSPARASWRRRAPAGPVYVNVPVEVLLEPVEAAAERSPVAAAGPHGQRTARAGRRASRTCCAAPSARSSSPSPAAGHRRSGTRCSSSPRPRAIPVVEPQSARLRELPAQPPAAPRRGPRSPGRRRRTSLVLVNCRAPWYPPQRQAGPGPRPWSSTRSRSGPSLAYQVLDADHYLARRVGPDTGGARPNGCARATRSTRRLRPEAPCSAAAARATLAPRPHGRPPKRPPSADARRCGRARSRSSAALRRPSARRRVVVDETITHSRVAR